MLSNRVTAARSSLRVLLRGSNCPSSASLAVLSARYRPRYTNSSPSSALKAFSLAGLFSTTALSYSPFTQKMAPKDIVEDAISSSTVTVFSKTYCPYCRRAKELLAEEYPNVKTRILELDELPDGAAMQEYLLQKTGQRTVPSIFINQDHIGGCDNLVRLNTAGELEKRMAKL